MLAAFESAEVFATDPGLVSKLLLRHSSFLS